MRLELADENAYLFAAYDDGDPYNWLETLGCFSPIIHLQQTDGNVSQHWPFNDRFNAKGIIAGKKVLDSLYKSYLQTDMEMPPVASPWQLTSVVIPVALKASAGSVTVNSADSRHILASKILDMHLLTSRSSNRATARFQRPDGSGTALSHPTYLRLGATLVHTNRNRRQIPL